MESVATTVRFGDSNEDWYLVILLLLAVVLLSCR